MRLTWARTGGVEFAARSNTAIRPGFMVRKIAEKLEGGNCGVATLLSREIRTALSTGLHHWAKP